MRHTFSLPGAIQLASDVGHICALVDAALGPGVVGVGGEYSGRSVRRLNEGLLLLQLGGGDGGGSPQLGLGLWEVEKRLFKDNESARLVLAELGIELLAEVEARMVLERRVEVGS